MDFISAISRCPRPYRADLGAEVAARFTDAPAELRALIEGAAGCSPYLAGLAVKEADWISGLADTPSEQLLDAVIEAVHAAAPADQEVAFRQAKRRVALLAGLADLGGVWPLEKVTQALTRLADACVHAGMCALVGAEIARGKLPGLKDEDAATAGGMCALAMGKMGAGELNYSSDVDLICLFDETRFDPDAYTAARASFVRVTRRLTALLSQVTAEGYVFRTDLRLRPDASVTPVCIAMETAERYYESVGRTWERAAFIKARSCGGDVAAGQRFLDRLTPFVWRKHLDFAAIQDAHDMRLRIRDHKQLGGALVLDGHDMKLGRGGIREIEFFTQTRQIIAGGRDPQLRVRGTVEGLARLLQAGWVDAETVEVLTGNYRFFREVEHRLQMIGDAQTHALPSSADGFDRLAAFVDRDADALRADLTERLEQTATLTEAFFAPDAKPVRGDDAARYLEKWRSFPSLRSPRAAEIFQRLFPEIRQRLDAAARPDEALQAFERFLAGLPAGVQVLSLFEATPQLQQLIVDICTASADLAGYLSRNAHVFDAVLGGEFFSPWPGAAGLEADLAARLAAQSAYEGQLDQARRWQKEWHFRIGVHLLRGLIEPSGAGQQYSDLAEATLAAMTPAVSAQFALKHGPAPGRGAAIVAMGSLGLGQLNARSDLDLIVVYDAQGADSSDGPRPLNTRAYFARFTQALITALSAPTAEGRLYEVDMRLRPSGQSGPVATSLEAYAAYQSKEAWLWEHMALTRARAVAGDAAIAADIAELRAEILASPRAPAAVATELEEMRDRLARAGRVGGVWTVKEGQGGARDIDLLAQGLALAVGCARADTAGQLDAAVSAGLLSAEAGDALSRIHRLYADFSQVALLLTEAPFDADRVGAGGLALVLQVLSQTQLKKGAARLEKCRKEAASLVKQTVDMLAQNGSNG